MSHQRPPLDTSLQIGLAFSAPCLPLSNSARQRRWSDRLTPYGTAADESTLTHYNADNSPWICAKEVFRPLLLHLPLKNIVMIVLKRRVDR